jgi:hypothetical protein
MERSRARKVRLRSMDNALHAEHGAPFVLQLLEL